MGIFRKAEKGLEGLVEGGFGRAFKSSVQPVELAHKLAKEMGDHKTVGVSHVYVPGDYDIYLGSNDYARLTALGDSLKGELANYLVALARREGWTLVAPPSITLHEDDDLRVGEFGIGTRQVAEPPEAPVGVSASPPLAAPAVAVPPTPASPGPLLDQTVLYQQPVPAAPAPPQAVMHGREGRWELRETVTVLGRSRHCDIVLTDPNVSRQHAEVRREGDSFVVRDLGSTNGLRVNRQRVQQAALKHGDRVELGTTELVFERVS